MIEIQNADLQKQGIAGKITLSRCTKLRENLIRGLSGIAPAIMTGYLLDLPVVFAKKKSPKTIQNVLSTKVRSFTKDREYDVVISADFLTPEDNVLFVDDFLAYGNAALGVIELVKQAGANLVGMGFIIEKEFQNGRKRIEEQGIRVESLAIIEDLSHCEIKIK